MQICLASIKKYYPFGSVMPNRKNGSALGYRYGFNGKENDPESVGTNNGTQDYGMRIYNPSLGKFLSVDPISSKFPMLSPYQFASNTPIWAIDLDGLEAAVINSGAQTLVVVVQGYSRNKTDPPNGKTQAKNNTKNDYVDVAGISYITLAAKDMPAIQVVVYSSSTSENTKSDIVETIKNYRAIVNNGTVILAGHSLGADNIIELVNEHPDLKIDALISLDIADFWDDDNIPENVGIVYNFYNATDGVFGSEIGGEKVEITNPLITKGKNIPTTYAHTQIDNKLSKVVSNLIIVLNNQLNSAKQSKSSKNNKIKEKSEAPKIQKKEKSNNTKPKSEPRLRGY